jgi:hypothetical protein
MRLLKMQDLYLGLFNISRDRFLGWWINIGETINNSHRMQVNHRGDSTYNPGRSPSCPWGAS